MKNHEKSDFIGNFPDWTVEFYQAEPRILDAFLCRKHDVIAVQQESGEQT